MNSISLLTQWMGKWMGAFLWLGLLLLVTGCRPPLSETASTPSVSAELSPSTPTPTPTLMVGGGAEPTPQPTAVTFCTRLELEVSTWVTADLGVFYNRYGFEGRIPLEVRAEDDPPQVRGEAALPVRGGGYAGECTITDSGEVEYKVEGVILFDGEGGMPQLHLKGEYEYDNMITTSCGGEGGMPQLHLKGEYEYDNMITTSCGGGGGAQMPGPEGFSEVVLPLAEGASASGSAGAGGVQAESKWVLHLLCP